ncbi:ATP-binding protein [Roseovarius aestuarii]|nr:ATP-binding protein [Roseovarius aestuarii]
MIDRIYRLSPAHVFLGTVVFGLALGLLTVLVAMRQPYLELPTGAVPVKLASQTLTEADFLQEPDQLGNYQAIRAFMKRQEVLATLLRANTVEMTYQLNGAEMSRTLTPRTRHMGELPFAFWFQIGVGMVSLCIGGWVLGLRREDWGARMFALTALMVPVFAMPAAIYSTRQIALGGDLFHLLSSLNGLGALSFGVALIGLFSQYPKPLFHPRWLFIPAVLYGALAGMHIVQLGPDNAVGLGTLSQMVAALVLGVAQWVFSRREPLNRAGLRWFILISLLGCSLFISLSAAPVVLGLADDGLIPQGYAFAFFNVMHIGLALGVLRYKVFNLDRWSYYIWLWLSGIVLILVLDIMLIRFLQGQPWASLGAALLIAGFVYFPLRQLLLKLLLQRRTASLSGRMGQIVNCALAPSQREQVARWDELLEDVYEPLAPPERYGDRVETPQLAENGLALLVPGVDGLDARRLRYALKGRRLFNPADIEVAANLVQMHDLAAESRHSYERGVLLERDRISRDIHDNIGAQLLSALHSPEPQRKDDLLRDSLSDLRAIINDGFQAEYALGPVLADLRTETTRRLESGGVSCSWHGPDLPEGEDGPVLPFELINGLRSILREAVSNILRHADANHSEIEIKLAGQSIDLSISDDGRGLPLIAQGGNGTSNIAERAAALHGQVTIGRRPNAVTGTQVAVTLPIRAKSWPEVAE